jgi:hypothetical protein
MKLEQDAFSSGQIGSKIWLAENLESAVAHYQKENLFLDPLRVLLVGGWYATTNFILGCRNVLTIEYVRSLDINPEACENADLINEHWVWQHWKFKSINGDANSFGYRQYTVVINTSIEHIESSTWFNLINPGTLVVLQSNNMEHDDHVKTYISLDDFSSQFPLSNTFLSAEKEFVYPTWNFKRFMKIGIK